MLSPSSNNVTPFKSHGLVYAQFIKGKKRGRYFIRGRFKPVVFLIFQNCGVTVVPGADRQGMLPTRVSVREDAVKDGVSLISRSRRLSMWTVDVGGNVWVCIGVQYWEKETHVHVRKMV